METLYVHSCEEGTGLGLPKGWCNYYLSLCKNAYGDHVLLEERIETGGIDASSGERLHRWRLRLRYDGRGRLPHLKQQELISCTKCSLTAVGLLPPATTFSLPRPLAFSSSPIPRMMLASFIEVARLRMDRPRRVSGLSASASFRAAIAFATDEV